MWLAHWWLTSPIALSLPRLPESFLLPLMRSVGVQSAEDAMDVVELVTLGLSLMIVSALTWLGWFLWRRRQNALTSRASGRAKARH